MATYLVYPDDAEQGVPKFFTNLKTAKAYAAEVARKINLNVRVWKENLKTGLDTRAATVRPAYLRKGNPTKEYEFGVSGAPADTGMRRIVRASSLQEAQQILRDEGWDTNKLWWAIRSPKMKGRRGQSLRPNPDILDAIRPGMRVTIVDRFGKERSGKAVMRGPGGWVLNMGGPHGTPGIANENNIVRVSGKASGVGGMFLRANPRYLSVPEKHQLKIARQTLKYSDVGARIMGGPTKAESREIIRRLTGKAPKENPARQWRPTRQGDYWYVALYDGKRRIHRTNEPFLSRATALKHANYLNVEQRHATANPASTSAIPTRWTKATVYRAGKKVVARIGGGR